MLPRSICKRMGWERGNVHRPLLPFGKALFGPTLYTAHLISYHCSPFLSSTPRALGMEALCSSVHIHYLIYAQSNHAPSVLYPETLPYISKQLWRHHPMSFQHIVIYILIWYKPLLTWVYLSGKRRGREGSEIVCVSGEEGLWCLCMLSTCHFTLVPGVVVYI